MNIDSPIDMPKSHPTYTTRTLLTLTAFCGVGLAWTVDHIALSKENVRLKSRLARAERLEDMLERSFMSTTVIGRNVSDYPQLRLLVDHTVLPTDEAYRSALNTITYPEVIDASSDHEILYFDLANTGIEGDPFDFYLLISDGVIVKMRRGESLCL